MARSAEGGSSAKPANVGICERADARLDLAAARRPLTPCYAGEPNRAKGGACCPPWDPPPQRPTLWRASGPP